MTKKDYQAIAGAIYYERQMWETADIREQKPAHEALTALTNGLANVLAADNPRFEREFFVRACETGDDTRGGR